MYLKKGSEAFDRPSKSSQSHGHALDDVQISIVDAKKFWPWYEIKPIAQQFMSIKIDNNYPDWFVLAADVAGGVPGDAPITDPTPIHTGISDEQAAAAFVTFLKWCKQK